jgi:hypothetical protein
MLGLSLTLLFALCCNALVQQYPLDIEGLHKLQRKNANEDSYLHTKEFFDSIHSGKKYFEKIETKEHALMESTTYKNLSIQALHTTIVKTTLFPQNSYFSLDDSRIAKHIRDIDSVALIDCNAHNINIGDYYVGTSSSPLSNVQLHSNQESKVGFIFSRQVVAIKEIDGCVRVLTSIVHPLQIMDTQIETAVHFPYDRVYVPSSKRLLRGEADAFIEPDAPLLICSDEEVTSKMATIHKTGEDSTTIRGVPFDYSYALDVKGNECLYADATLPGSINYNHASGTNAIRKNIVLGNGATCTNCYSFVGASVLAVFNIFGGKMSTFAFEAKEGGGAGFNIGILIKDPSFSASKYINLAGPGATSSIPIVTGLSLEIQFGGAWATIKGSGSAKGEARFSSGYTLYEEDSIMYSKAKWSANHELTNSNQLKPTYSVTGFKVSSMSLSAILSLSARVEFRFGGSIPVVNVGASIDFSSVLTAVAQYVKKGQGALTDYKMQLVFADQSRSLSILDSKHAPLTKYPGDQIVFQVFYEGLNPNEKHELYFNLYHSDFDNAHGFPIKTHTFKSSRSGKGVVRVDWKVPHDSKLMQKDVKNKEPKIHFSVHSSARLDRFHTDKKIRLAQKKDLVTSQSIFQYPHEESIVPTSSKIQIKWDKDQMKFFNHYPGTDGMGEDRISPKVSLILVVINDTNTDAYQLANHISNTGSYETVLPEFLRTLGQRFFLIIHDSNEYTKMAWHKGTFSLTPPRSRFPARNHTNDLDLVYVEPPILADGCPLWGNCSALSLVIPETQRLLANGPKTCPNAALSLLLQVEFGFEGFTLLGKKYSLGSTTSNPFTIIPQTNFCI